MSETRRGLVMDFAAIWPSILMPTHTHDFGKHRNVYGRSKQHSCRASPDCQKSDSLMFETRKQFQNLARITIFKITILLSQLGSLVICTHDLTILTKIKEMTHYCESFGYGGKTLSIHVSTILTNVSVPAEDG
jgi:hypothetical protein